MIFQWKLSLVMDGRFMGADIWNGCGCCAARGECWPPDWSRHIGISSTAPRQLCNYDNL